MSKRLVITISEELLTNLETLAKKLGVTPTEYIRFLIVKAQEKANEEVFS